MDDNGRGGLAALDWVFVICAVLCAVLIVLYVVMEKGQSLPQNPADVPDAPKEDME
jgi:hypothetical protein